MHLFFSAGEPSGDQHAARLIEQLRRRVPDLRATGFGGPEMAAAGLDQHYPLTNLAVIGVGAVIPLLKTFWGLYRQAGQFLESERPDAVILVDFPGFNWWIAKAARRAGVPVYYYCPPQLWAWAPWRIRKVRKWVDGVLSVLPFEAEWYRCRGVSVDFVGHPFFDEVAEHPLDQRTVSTIRNSGGKAMPPSSSLSRQSRQIVAILPGSRKQEVERNFPAMLQVIEALSQRHPGVHFPVACYKQWHLDRCTELLAGYGRPLPVSLHRGKTPEVIEAADCCLMVSGSVSLELLARRKPGVVLYKAGAVTYCFGNALKRCRFLSLPNLIADSYVMPEFPFWFQERSAVSGMINSLDRWLSDPSQLQRAKDEMSAIADLAATTGGIARAAETILQRLAARPAERNSGLRHAG